MYQVHFYRTSRGESPVEEFLGSLDNQTKAKVAQFIGLLEEYGPQLKRPIADKLEGKIYELRPKQARILYFFFIRREIVLVHGFLKKTNAVKIKELDLAERRMADWLARRKR
jgi:phage-related protein